MEVAEPQLSTVAVAVAAAVAVAVAVEVEVEVAVVGAAAVAVSVAATVAVAFAEPQLSTVAVAAAVAVAVAAAASGCRCLLWWRLALWRTFEERRTWPPGISCRVSSPRREPVEPTAFGRIGCFNRDNCIYEVPLRKGVNTERTLHPPSSAARSKEDTGTYSSS